MPQSNIRKHPETKVNEVPHAGNETEEALEDLNAESRDEDQQIHGRKPSLDEVEEDPAGL